MRCELSGLSVNVGESQITQSFKVRDLGVTFNQFLKFDEHITAIICREYMFILETFGKFAIYYCIIRVLLLFMHLLVVD